MEVGFRRANACREWLLETKKWWVHRSCNCSKHWACGSSGAYFLDLTVYFIIRDCILVEVQDNSYGNWRHRINIAITCTFYFDITSMLAMDVLLQAILSLWNAAFCSCVSAVSSCCMAKGNSSLFVMMSNSFCKILEFLWQENAWVGVCLVGHLKSQKYVLKN